MNVDDLATTRLRTVTVRGSVFCAVARLVVRAHRDQRGTISIVSVFALILLTMLLGMVINSTRQVVRKVQMQNAADAATHTGGVVLARGMNTLAFTNHLISDVFALTAFMREARDRTAESFTPETLEHWLRIAPHMASSEFPPFAALGAIIPDKVQLEADLILAYSDLHQAISEQFLPVLEEILAMEMIPEFQRALVLNTPRIAQSATNEVARRHGQSWPQPVVLYGALWNTLPDPVGGVSEDSRRTLPVVDPVLDMLPNQQDYIVVARNQRRVLAEAYLSHWNFEKLYYFDNYGKMSQFANIWRIITCGHLEILLEQEYPDSNLPFQIREVPGDSFDQNATLEQDYMFVGVVYQRGMREEMPGIFNNPIEADKQAYAQVSVFVPTRRLINPDDVIRQDWWYWYDEYGRKRWTNHGSAGSFPIEWGLITQNWINQLTPATAPALPTILSSPPYVLDGVDIVLPTLDNVRTSDLPWLSHH